jgi:hypothetical protein
MPFDFGDVVPAPFPFTSLGASKKRPAVVVSGRAYNTARPRLDRDGSNQPVSAESGVGRCIDP